MTNAQAIALVYVAPQRAELQCCNACLLTAEDGDRVQRLHLKMLWSGISRGTERLVFEGRVPQAEWNAMRCPRQIGGFGFPVRYGYQAVALVEGGPPEWLGRRVFAMLPHQDAAIVPESAVTPVPDGVPPRRAILAANMETALNAVWDAAILPAQRIVVVGGGVVGCLIAWLCGGVPATHVTLVDCEVARDPIARALGVRFALPDAAAGDADCVIHASGTAAGAALALSLAGFEASVVEVSWHGDAPVALPLGGAFHSQRLRLLSSQVGHVAPAMRPRWSHRRRLAAALALLDDPALDCLITDEVAFADLPAALPRLLGQGSVLGIAIRY